MVAFQGRGEDGPDCARPLNELHEGDLLPTKCTYDALRYGERAVDLVPRHPIALPLALIFEEQVAPKPLPGRRATAAGLIPAGGPRAFPHGMDTAPRVR
jgi:hypothetical protein